MMPSWCKGGGQSRKTCSIGSCPEELLGEHAPRSVMPQIAHLVNFEGVLAPALPKSSGSTNERRCVSDQHGTQKNDVSVASLLLELIRLPKTKSREAPLETCCMCRDFSTENNPSAAVALY